MKLTPDQRRQRLFDIMEDNSEYMQIKAATERAKARFQKLTAWLPPKLRNHLREYPGMFYFLHQRMIDTVCQQMRFPDED